MAQPPLVSCLLISYAQERFVVEAVESVLAQAEDYPRELLDIVVIDDCSPDATGELLEAYRDRVRLVREPVNGGSLHTTNRAIELARGELATFISGDDVWPRGRIAAQARAMVERPWAAICHGDARVIDDAGAVLAPSYRAQHELYGVVGDVRGRLLEKQPICAPTAMWRTALLKRLHPIGPPAVWNDWWMFLHAAAEGDAICLSGVNSDYRQHGENMVHGHAGVAQAKIFARELPFRRWLLTDADHVGVPWREVVAAWATLDWMTGVVIAHGLGVRDELLPVDEDGAAAARELAAALDGDPLRDVCTLVRGLAHDPHSPHLRAALPALTARATAATPSLPITQPVVLALANEARWTGGLLAEFTEAWDRTDPVTLVIDACGWTEERVMDEIVPLASDAGLDGPGGPDVFVVTDGRPWPRERLRAVLSHEPGTGEAFDVPLLGNVAAGVAHAGAGAGAD